MADKKLNIIDEAGNIIGKETRKKIHQKGLLHREIHIWFYTPKGEIIFQHRSNNTDTFPNFLDATVGGHVEIGEDFKTAALKELEEEAGITDAENNLTLIRMYRGATNKGVRMTNNVLRAVYAYRFDGRIEDLKIEKDKAIGFELWPFEKIFNVTAEDRKRFIPSIINDEPGIFRKIQKICLADKSSLAR